MSSADFLLVKPLKLDGAVSFSRASEATYFDAAGVLQTAPPDTLRVTYDPADLSKAPYALVEKAKTNFIRNNTMQGAVVGTVAPLPTGWTTSSVAGVGLSIEVTEIGSYSGIDCVDVRIFGTPSQNSGSTIDFALANYIAALPEQLFALSCYLKLAAGSISPNFNLALSLSERTSGGAQIGAAANGPIINLGSQADLLIRHDFYKTTINADVRFVVPRLRFNVYGGQPTDFTIRIGLPQFEYDEVTSPIKTSGAAVTRAADSVGPGAGLVYSNVPITEPLWVAGTYALGAKVRNAANFVFESLAAGNTAALTDKTKWPPLGITNRLKMFDKAVNSQTTAPEALTVVVKAGQLANTLTLLNVAGSEVTVTQSDSGYSRPISLVSHNVLSWYDFWYQEPQWVGDITIGDVPPYINSLLTVHVKSPTNLAALGGFFMGRAKFIGKTQWGLKAGILSYSGEEEDDFGNVTLLPRDSAKKMNFEVSIPRGYEDEVYRFLRAADNVEMVAIASTNWSMTQSYGYLGQWEVPLGIEGEKMPVEWRGLI